MKIGKIGDILPVRKFGSKKPVVKPVSPLAITSIANITLAENTTLTHTLTANKTVTWTKVGGLDQALFNVSGNVLSMSARDFETPTDSDNNNNYVVVVRATDSTGVWIEQPIVVTITNIAEGSGLDATLAPLKLELDPTSPVNGSSPRFIVYTNSTDHEVGDTIRLYARDKAGALLNTYPNQISLSEATDPSAGTEGRADFGLAALGAGTRRWTADILKTDGRWTPLSNMIISGPEDQEPILTNLSSVQNGSTAGKALFTTDTADGVAVAVFTTTNSPPLQSAFNSSTFTLTVTSAGAKEIIGTGLLPSQIYYAWVQHTDANGNATAITPAGNFTTLAASASVAKLTIGQGSTGAGPMRNIYMDVAANGLDFAMNNDPGAISGVMSPDAPPAKMHFEFTITGGPQHFFYFGVTDSSTVFGPAAYPSDIGFGKPGIMLNTGGSYRELLINGSSELFATHTQAVGDVYSWDIDRVGLVATLRKKSGGVTTTILNDLSLTSQLPTNWRVFIGCNNTPAAGTMNFGATAFAIPPLTGYTGW